MLKPITFPGLFLAAAVLLVGGLAGCDVEQTEEGEMPEIDVKENGEVEVKEGKLPEYDIDGSDADTESNPETARGNDPNTQ